MTESIYIDYAKACALVEQLQDVIPEGMDVHLFLSAVAILIEAHSYDPSGINHQVEFIQKMAHELYFQHHLSNAQQVGHA